MKKPKKPNLNQVILSGVIVTAPQVFIETQRLVFMLLNEAGRFYVQTRPTPSQTLRLGMFIVVRGRLFSVPLNGKDVGRIAAEEIVLLADMPEDEADAPAP